MPQPCPPLKRQTDPDRPYTADLHTGFCSIDCCTPHRRWGRSTSRESVPGRPANSIQAGSGYKDHVVKPAEVRRNDAVGPAATIPYSRCHNQARVVDDPTTNHRHSPPPWYSLERQRTARRAYESYETSFVIRNDCEAVLITPVCWTYRRPRPEKPCSPCEASREHVNSANWGNILVYPYLVPLIIFSILACIPSGAQRQMCELIFGTDKWDENCPCTTFQQNASVAYSNALFLPWHGVAGPRDSVRSTSQRC